MIILLKESQLLFNIISYSYNLLQYYLVLLFFSFLILHQCNFKFSIILKLIQINFEIFQTINNF